MSLLTEVTGDIAYLKNSITIQNVTISSSDSNNLHASFLIDKPIAPLDNIQNGDARIILLGKMN